MDLYCTQSSYTEHALSQVYRELSSGDLIKTLGQTFWKLAIWHRGAYWKDEFTIVPAGLEMKNSELQKREFIKAHTCKHIYTIVMTVTWFTEDHTQQ